MSLMEEYYEWFLEEQTDFPLSKRILFAIMGDFLDRRGFRQEWDACDDDVREEVLQTNLKNIEKELAKG